MPFKGLLTACATMALFVATGATAKSEFVGPPVVFAKGANCWRYHGKASSFRIELKTGQKLVVSAYGEAHNAIGRNESFTYQMRSVSLMSAEGAPIALNIGEGGTIVAPHTGKFDITLWPRAMQGFDGGVAVCKA